jgi:hypothetical protein
MPWLHGLSGEVKASRPGGRLTTGDEDPTPAPRISAAGNGGLSIKHLVGNESVCCEAKTLSGPPAGLGPIEAQQATNDPIVRDAVDQGPSLDFRLLGQLGRAHWATFGPVTLLAQYRPINRGTMMSC